MPDLLLELRSEEIPARMQAPGVESLQREVLKRLKACGLDPQSMETFATPRRLALIARGLPDGTPPSREERRGPREGAPESALEGFLRSTGVARREDLELRGQGMKRSWFASWETPGQSLEQHLVELLPEAIRAVRWPKSMRWGRGGLRWVRPLRGILCMVGEAGAGRPVALDIEGIPCQPSSCGHPFLAPGAFSVENIDHYESQLATAKVVLRTEMRRERIREGALAAARAEGLELVEDHKLMDEIAGLVEWPVVLTGWIEKEFAALPGEILRISMRTHQKFFSLQNPENGDIAGFVAVADTEAVDGGARIREGYGRVLRARLKDARFFWENDCRTGLDEMRCRLSKMLFHEAIGNMSEREGRITELAVKIASRIGADPGQARRAGELAKADLCSATVTEFPELQGIAGGRLAQEWGEPEAVVGALGGQYKPAGPEDAPVTRPVAAALVLADRADMLWGFFAAGLRPTGSRDPYALRRAALGILRTQIENRIYLSLGELIGLAETGYVGESLPADNDASEVLRAFLIDRLQGYLHDRGYRQDAVFAAIACRGNEEDPVCIQERAKALHTFLGRAEAGDLLAVYRRVSNILDMEAIGEDVDSPDSAFYLEDAEHSLAAALDRAVLAVNEALEEKDFLTAMEVLAALRGPTDAFFDQVLVNDPDSDIRRNRLHLLFSIRALMEQVAAFGEIGH